VSNERSEHDSQLKRDASRKLVKQIQLGRLAAGSIFVQTK
jgi:hypothetical protein